VLKDKELSSISKRDNWRKQELICKYLFASINVQGGGYWFTFLYKYCIISVFLRKHLPHPFGVLKKACCWLGNGHYLLPGYWASFTNGLLLLKWQSSFHSQATETLRVPCSQVRRVETTYFSQ
jgi:hypothetical protein